MLSEATKASAAEGGEEGDDKAKYKPLTKWQKWGYIFFGANMFALVIGRHVIRIVLVLHSVSYIRDGL